MALSHKIEIQSQRIEGEYSAIGTPRWRVWIFNTETKTRREFVIYGETAAEAEEIAEEFYIEDHLDAYYDTLGLGK